MKKKLKPKLNPINILIIFSLILAVTLTAEVVYFGYVKKAPDPSPIPLPESNKKVLEELNKFKP